MNISQVEFFGDGADPVTVLDIVYISEFPRGDDGLCAYCKGDPCAEVSPPSSLIVKFFERNSWAATCPLCNGRQS